MIEPATEASAIDVGAPATVNVIVVVLSPAAYVAPAAVAEAAETPTRTVYVPATSAVRDTFAGIVVPYVEPAVHSAATVLESEVAGTAVPKFPPSVVETFVPSVMFRTALLGVPEAWTPSTKLAPLYC
jgi:hypothetical protein